MKKLMQEITDKLYTVLASIDDDKIMRAFFDQGQRRSYMWDEPEFHLNFLKALQASSGE
jgi:hypothetical protein